MLEQKHRLTKKTDFLAMSSQGRSIFGALMTMRVRAVPDFGPKIGFVTPVKSMKKAVDRNRVKRRMRHVFRELMDEVPKQTHLVVLLKPTVNDVPWDELVHETRRMLKRIPEALAKPPSLSPAAKKRRAKKYKGKKTTETK